jgi:hypothetical protein
MSMALRLVEVVVHKGNLQRLPQIIEGVPVVDIWTTESDDGGGLVRILLDAKHTEALSDSLSREFGSRDGF